MDVLIVDDSGAIRERLAALVETLDGIDVVGLARDALEGLEKASALRPDVILLDLAMPNGGGLAVLEGLDRNGESPTVIVLTNYAIEQYERECLRLGARYFFDKARDIELIPSVLRSIERESETR